MINRKARTQHDEISLSLTYSTCHNPAKKKKTINHTALISINYTTCQNCAVYSVFLSGMTSHSKIAEFNGVYSALKGTGVCGIYIQLSRTSTFSSVQLQDFSVAL